MSFTWNNFAYQITLDMDNDSWIEEIVANMMFEDCLMEDANEEIKLDHMKVDGSGPRSVKRSDYSRCKKEIKPNFDPKLNLKWMRWINDIEVQNPETRHGKRFRRLFRVPFPLFDAITVSCKSTGDKLFNYAEKDCCGNYCIPIQVKILFCLRVMSGGM